MSSPNAAPRCRVGLNQTVKDVLITRCKGCRDTGHLKACSTRTQQLCICIKFAESCFSGFEFIAVMLDDFTANPIKFSEDEYQA